MAWYGNIKQLLLVGIVTHVALCYGKTTVTIYKTHGEDGVDLRCAHNAARPGMVATTRHDGICRGLDWNWVASQTSYDSNSTNMEKIKVVTSYQTPMVLGKHIELPIRFTTGSTIDMYIEFTTVNFTYAEIHLMNTLDVDHDLTDEIPETEMILVAIYPPDGVMVVKTNHDKSWVDQATSDYTFHTGTTYKISFKALDMDCQVLVNDVAIVRYPHVIAPENARMLFFTDDVGMLLHRIEFSGNFE